MSSATDDSLRDMTKVTFSITTSLDGYLAGPNPTLDDPLGIGGEQLHEWALRLASWREQHGMSGGETGIDSEVVEESTENVGAYLMGRQMFGGGPGSWGDEPWEGWWGDTPPFGVPVFVLTHHAREPLEKQGGTTFHFVTDGIESALEQARAAAGDKDVVIAGGAEVAQQYLNAGAVEEFQITVAPMLLGGGTRLLDNLDPDIKIERTRVIESPVVTHLKYRVVK
jgi:dihydrofolate reductase